MKIAIIGGGAAGFFAAIATKENYPEAQVVIFEKAEKILRKVKISGGGRCNLTNACPCLSELAKAYPRGEKSLKKAFQIFNNQDARRWFESRGVPLVIEDDNCVFPASQNSQSIIDCFLEQTGKLKIAIKIGRGVKAITPVADRLQLDFTDKDAPAEVFDKVIVATGGSPQKKGLAWLEKLGHKIEDPVPSLFSLMMANETITTLMGVVVENVSVTLQGSKLKAEGPLLITHWGMSGPVILKLSSLGARVLSASGYNTKIQINWVNQPNNDAVMETLDKIVTEHPNKFLINVRPYLLPDSLWRYLLAKREFSTSKPWRELGRKGLNKLVDILSNDVYTVSGKTSFKEEFVTCGGVSRESIDFKTMQSRVCKNLYFAGEVMDIDGITGGYNFQAAWTSAFIAAKLH
ncbi:MAG: NAD(P)/FAD-dependent oxidoreductase [Deltaproteobacteria bacterium]|nr:NAD(P)/FAD-dependent oxidoreductase [Deltaproteobacteria bacterium]